MLDIKEKRHITVVGRGGASNIDWEDIENKPDFATVATSGSYNDLTDKPEIPGQVNADWDATSGVSQILNKPNLATVATSGSYNDLTNKPDLTHYVEDTDLATVATSGSYDDLSNKPTIPAAQVNADWNASSGVQQILNKPTLATVATTGSYNDLTDKPTVTQEQADWSQTDTTAVDYIKNKPEIPIVPVYAIESLTFTMSDSTIKTLDFFTLPDYFYVENLHTIGTGTLTIKKENDWAPTIEVFKSDDKINWTSMGTTDTTGITASVPPLSKLYLKASPTVKTWGKEYGNGNIISMNTNHNIGGNIASLLYGDDFSSFKYDSWGDTYMFYHLFYNNTNLISAGNLTIPTMQTASQQAFAGMFWGCTSLTTAPKYLHCYNPGTNAFNNMFYGCTSLTQAPHLIVDSQYYGANRGFGSMYDNCTSLNKVVITVNFLGDKSWNNWLTTCAATGDFYSLGLATPTAPDGWTVHTSL